MKPLHKMCSEVDSELFWKIRENVAGLQLLMERGYYILTLSTNLLCCTKATLNFEVIHNGESEFVGSYDQCNSYVLENKAPIETWPEIPVHSTWRIEPCKAPQKAKENG